MHARLLELRTEWQRAVGRHTWKITAGLASVWLVATLLIARIGTDRARLSAAMLIGFALATYLTYRIHERKLWRDAVRTLRRVTLGATPDARSRAERALRLSRSPQPGTSAPLAAQYAVHALSKLDPIAMNRGRKSRGRWLGWTGAGLLALGFGGCIMQPFRVFEGADVLIAKDGQAPVPMMWLVTADVEAKPPSYLHEEPQKRAFHTEVSLAHGTALTVRAEPVHEGRALFLSDGQNEVPFAVENDGHVVVHFSVERDATWRVIAKFGSVAIAEPEAMAVHCIEDQAPNVHLKDAPRIVGLADENTPDEFLLEYDAQDDHGLREIQVVFRSAGREERRVISRLDGETKQDRGSYVLRAKDPWLKKSHAPVAVTIEAKDNDPVTGPKWGKSAAYTFMPPDVGQLEATRMAALRTLRDTFVDGLALRIPALSTDIKARATALSGIDQNFAAESAAYAESLTRLRPGLAPRLRRLLDKQRIELQKRHTAEQKSPSTETHKAALKASEHEVLVLDALIANLGARDTKEVSKKLADAADGLAENLGDYPRSKDPAQSRERIQAFEGVLHRGGAWMVQLGALGRDIGEIVEAYGKRADRGFNASDFAHAKLAAEDLAERLRKPDPSFGAKGGGGGGSPEGGGQPNEGDDSEESEQGEGSASSEVEQAFREAMKELEQLAQDHAGELAKLEGEMERDATESEAKGLADELQKHAESIKKSAGDIPKSEPGNDGAAEELNDAKRAAEDMAQALKSGKLREAERLGKDASAKLDEAHKKLGKGGADPTGKKGEGAKGAKASLDGELGFIQEKLAGLRKGRGEQGAFGPDAMKESAFAKRMGKFGKSDGDKKALPPEALEALKEANDAGKASADALSKGDLDKGLAEARKAQQKLEQAKNSATGKGEKDEGGSAGGGGSSDEDGGDEQGGRAEIPTADAHEGPAKFRKRVLEGLSHGEQGKLKDAVRRYAEGLLR